jgi:hypothetical protein
MKRTLISRVLCALLLAVLVLSLSSCIDLSALLGGAVEGFTPTEIKEVIATDFGNAYAEQLNQNEAAVFAAVSAAKAGENVFAVSFPEVLEISKGREPTEKEQEAAGDRISFWITNALYAVWLDCPEIFWLETGSYRYEYTIESDKEGVCAVSGISLTVEKRENAENAATLKAQLDSLLSSLSLKKSTDAETVKAINDYLCQRIEYVLDAEERNNVVGALLEQACVCEGYAQAFKLLCDRYGIAAISLVGNGVTREGTEGHMWNAVRLDGVWYAVDTTWNDTAKTDSFLLVGKTDSYDGYTFAASHLVTQTRGNSKVFAIPALSENAYR